MSSSWPKPVASSVASEIDVAPPADATMVSDVARARDGDRLAFDLLHRRHAAAVHGLLLAHRSADDVDDLLQEVFLTAWRRLSTLREDESFGPWLLAIARNARAAAVDETCRANEILGLVRQLPEAYRETLALRLIEGFSGPEIAAATGLTHGSVRVNLHRGMQLLRERLRAEGYA